MQSMEGLAHSKASAAAQAQSYGISGRVLSGGLGFAIFRWPSRADALQMWTASAVTAGLAGSSSLNDSRCTNSPCCCCRLEYLSKFMPAPSPHVHSFAAALVQRMASRVLIFFVRHASLLRPLSDTGRLQLAKVGCLHSFLCLFYCR